MQTKNTTLRDSVIIYSPIEKTWKFLTDFNNVPKWDLGVEKIIEISPGPVGVGTKVTDIGLGLKRHWPETFWVNEFTPNHILGLVWKGSYGTAHVRYTLEEVPEGTKLNAFTYGDYRFPWVIFTLILGRASKQNFHGDLVNIKRLTEEAESD